MECETNGRCYRPCIHHELCKGNGVIEKTQRYYDYDDYGYVKRFNVISDKKSVLDLRRDNKRVKNYRRYGTR